MSIKVALIGIDGLSPYVTRKYLVPILEASITAKLISIIPPITAPAWVSLATGLNPGKTGIIDFLNPADSGRRKLRPVSSNAYWGLSIWDYASLVGYRVCVLDYPMLYPPYQVNGVIIPGFLSPEWVSYPETLIKELQDRVSPHWEHIYFAIDRRYNDVIIFLEDLLKSLEKKIKWSLYLLCKEDWDLFVDVISHSDWLFHRCWHILDPQHEIATKQAELREETASTEARSLIEYFFDLFARYITEVEARTRNTIVVSDHGFGPLKYIINSAKLLKILRLTCFNLLSPLVKVRGLISKVKWFLMPQAFEKTPFELNIDPYDVLNYEHSILYTLPHDELIMALYINKKYSERRSEILAYVKSKVEALSHDLGFSTTIVDLHRLYWGPKVSLLPDALLIVSDYAAYFEFKPYNNYLVQIACKRRYTGTHRIEGVFIAKGTNFKKAIDAKKFELEISLLDVAPTVLKLLGLPPPRYIDGRARDELLRGEVARPNTTELIRLKAHYIKILKTFRIV